MQEHHCGMLFLTQNYEHVDDFRKILKTYIFERYFDPRYIWHILYYDIMLCVLYLAYTILGYNVVCLIFGIYYIRI